MGLLDGLRRKLARRPETRTGQPTPFQGVGTAWLPGDVEVQVAGESYHEEAIFAAQTAANPSGPSVAVLVPQPTNPFDQYAVAILVNDNHVGYLHANVTRRVQPALLEFARKHGCGVSCPAEIRQYDIGFQVILFLDCSPLGISPDVFEVIPELARVLGGLLSRLDDSQPVLGGIDDNARARLAEAESKRAAVDADYERGRDAWPRVERLFRTLVEELRRRNDPTISAAWLGLARSIRYQRDHRDETLAAYVEALYYDRGNVDAWCELIEYASAAPHVPTLVSVFERIPSGSKVRPLQFLLAIADGGGRLGNIGGTEGAHLRVAILDLIESQGDAESIAFLAGKAGLRAEKEGDIETAVTEWRRAITAGSTDGRVADRLSVWLVKQREYDEAIHVLDQALTTPPGSDALRDRLRRRRARCEQRLSRGSEPA